MLLLVKSFLQLPCLLKFPFFFTDEGSQHVTLSRSELEVWHKCVWILVPLINEVEDQLGIQHQWHICAFGSSGPLLSVSDDFSEFIFISFVISGRHMEGELLLKRTWSSASFSSSLCLQQSGPVEDCGGAEELVEAPEAIEMPLVL